MTRMVNRVRCSARETENHSLTRWIALEITLRALSLAWFLQHDSSIYSDRLARSYSSLLIRCAYG